MASDVPVALSCLAILVSIIAIVISLWVNERSLVTGRRPVLIFDYRGGEFVARNVGNGPAMNVALWLKGKDDNDPWGFKVLLPDLAKEREHGAKWLNEINPWQILATYQDYEGKKYFSRALHDSTKIGQPQWANEVGINKEMYVRRLKDRRWWQNVSLNESEKQRFTT